MRNPWLEPKREPGWADKRAAKNEVRRIAYNQSVELLELADADVDKLRSQNPVEFERIQNLALAMQISFWEAAYISFDLPGSEDGRTDSEQTGQVYTDVGTGFFKTRHLTAKMRREAK